MAGAITRGEVTVEEARPEHLELVLSKLEEMGAKIEEKGESIRVSLEQKPKAADIATLPYPGFPTDLQAQVVSLLSLAKGTSVVTENVFENRFIYIDELKRMGSDIRTDGHHAIIKGVRELTGAPVRVRDLRGGAALILAGLAAKGVTEVSDIFHVDRGYEKFEDKLASLGADISRVEESRRQKEMDYV
jgi:UDP-N-acetylglucosamine 1-carboxyvinyltransferase